MGYRAFFDEQRTFGVELEAVDVDREKLARVLRQQNLTAREMSWSQSKYVSPGWKITSDSSLVGKGTAEVVSPVLCGRDGLAEAALVADIMRQQGCEVNSSCGFHVHWNCRDFTGKNVLSLLRFYAKFEGVIDLLVSPTRRANVNLHCRSLVKDSTLDWVTELDQSERARALDIAVRFEARHHATSTVRTSSRYHKVNIQSYLSLGTIEFRQHQGTLNADKVTNWVIFTQQLVNKARYVSVSRKNSAKPTLGEMLRVLKIVDHEFIENQCTDPLILNLGQWLKRRYRHFSQGEEDHE